MDGISREAWIRVRRALQDGVPANERRRMVMLTAYDAIAARLAAQSGVDFILVGDSAATTVLGYTNTRDIEESELRALTRAVRRGAPDSAVIGDLPFGTYEESDEAAVAVSRRFVEAGADFIKLEGAGPIAERVRAIVAAGMPVIGHVGLLPQGAKSVEELRAKGRTAAEALQIVRDAIELEESGASLVVVEAVPSAVGAEITERLRIPVIGIGAGPHTTGQVLVYPDLLGLSPGKLARFVRKYAELGNVWTDAVTAFASDVRSGAYPSQAEGYGMPDDAMAEFQRLVTELDR